MWLGVIVGAVLIACLVAAVWPSRRPQDPGAAAAERVVTSSADNFHS